MITVTMQLRIYKTALGFTKCPHISLSHLICMTALPFAYCKMISIWGQGGGPKAASLISITA